MRVVIPFRTNDHTQERVSAMNAHHRPIQLASATQGHQGAHQEGSAATEGQEALHPANSRAQDRSAFRALAFLRGFNVEDIARASGIQIQNLLSWLSGNDVALTRHSRYTAWKILGAPDGELNKHRVHVWRLDAGSKTTFRRSMNALRQASTLIQGGELMRLEGPARGRLERLALREPDVYALSGHGSNVLILVKQPLFRRRAIECGDVQAKWKGGSAEASRVRVPQEMLVPVLSGNLTQREFDDLFVKQEMKSWSAAIIALRERGISPTDAIQWAMEVEQGSRKGENSGKRHHGH